MHLSKSKISIILAAFMLAQVTCVSAQPPKNYAIQPSCSFEIHQKATEWMLFINSLRKHRPGSDELATISQRRQLKPLEMSKVHKMIEESKKIGMLDEPVCLGCTLLHYVANLRIDCLVAELLKAGANPFIPSLVFGETPDFDYLVRLREKYPEVKANTLLEDEVQRIYLPDMYGLPKRLQVRPRKRPTPSDTPNQSDKFPIEAPMPPAKTRRFSKPSQYTQHSCPFPVAKDSKPLLRKLQEAAGEIEENQFIPTPPDELTEDQKQKLDVLTSTLTNTVIGPCRSTALHCAAKYNCTYMIEKLLDAGENIDAQNKNGSTALHLAVYYNRNEALELLISRGANTKLKNSSGNIPLMVALVNSSTLTPVNRVKLIPKDYTFGKDSSDDFKNTNGYTPYALAGDVLPTFAKTLAKIKNEDVLSKLLGE